jgi:hypothetical protein
MIAALIQLIFVCIAIGAIYYVITIMPIPEPFKKIATLAVLVVFIILVLGMLFGAVPLTKWPA